MSRFLAYLAFSATAFFSVKALAVETKLLTIGEKWSVVGVITSSKPENDVAVLRNNETSKTYTVTLGDSLPSEYSFRLTEIRRHNVVVSDGDKTFILSFVDEPTVSEEEDDFQNSVRFIDNYYRGLAESPIELFNKERRTDTTGTAAVVPAVPPIPVMPVKSFGTYNESTESRFDGEEWSSPEGVQEQYENDEAFATDEQLQNFYQEGQDTEYGVEQPYLEEGGTYE